MTGTNSLTIINPDDGKRYRLNIKGDIGRLTVGRVKQCLASASTCPIPADEQVLKLNGTSLSNDMDSCAMYGISRGATLTVECRSNVNPAASNPASFVSPQRRALEYQTIRQQESALYEDVTTCGDALHGKMEQLRSQLQAVDHRKANLERSKAQAERELEVLRQHEALAVQQRQRIAELREHEVKCAAERAADLAARREQLKAEEGSVRALAMQRLDNERRKAQVEQQRAEYEAEKERLQREREAYHQRAKERELSIREKEMEIEQRMLASERDRREIDVSRLISQQNRTQYYNRVGLIPPPDLFSQPQHQQVDWVASRDGNKGARVNSGNRNGISRIHDSVSASLHSEPSPMATLTPEENIKYACEEDGLHAGDNNEFSMPHTMQGKEFYSAYENAKANLHSMEEFLSVDEPLRFDENNTCVISVDGEFTLLVTFDAGTERLYVYSTLIPSIPSYPEVRLRVYEFLMEGALLGREMCGGGVGASLKNDFVLMSTSIHLPTSHPTTLRVITPLFVQSLSIWRKKLQELLGGESSTTPTPPPQQEQQQRIPKSQTSEKQGEDTIEIDSSPLHRFGLPRRAEDRSDRGAPQNSAGYSNSAPSDASAPSHRSSGRAVIGIEATESLTVNGVPSRCDAGVLVVNVGGPAAHAGIQVHDIIEKVDGNRVRSLHEFQREVAQLVPGTVVPFFVDRSGVQLAIAVKVGATA